MLTAIITLQQGDLPLGFFATILVLGSLTIAIDLWQRSQLKTVTPRRRMSPELAGSVIAASFVGILVFSGGTPQPFIYFQF